jgi:hypothetical protein
MLYGFFKAGYALVAGRAKSFLNDLASSFSPSYAFAGIDRGYSPVSEEVKQDRTVHYMSRNRFHKLHEINHQRELRELAEHPLEAARCRTARDHTPSRVLGTDGKYHHINRYEGQTASPDATPTEEEIRATLEAVNGRKNVSC